MAYSSKLANNLLCTPFDNKATVDEEISSALSLKEFFIECYLKPDFEIINPYNTKHDKNTEIYDFILKKEVLEDEIHSHKTMQANFDKWLNNKKNPKVYTICGNAGTGKTTYINYLKYNCSNKNWLIMDVSKAKDIVQWFGDCKSIISDFTLPNKKMYSCVLQQISTILFDFYSMDGQPDFKSIFKNLQLISKNYKNNLKDSYPNGKSFFDDFVINYKDYFKALPKNIEEHAVKIKKYFDDIETKYKFDSNQILREAIDILIIILRCQNIYNYDAQYIMVFDNLERFIACDEIYNKDLDDIRKSLISYSEDLNKINSCHRGLFKFIMVMRNRSAKMCKAKDQSTDELASNLDLSGWFIIDGIIYKKKTWLSKHNFTDDNMILLEQITGDLRICDNSALTGLKLQIDSLFNNNTRLVIDFIGSLIELPSNQYALTKYDEYWKQDSPVSRFAARSIIRGLLLKDLEDNDNLFKNLKAYSELENPDKNKRNKVETISGIGHARKILTVLYNHNTTYLPLSTLLSEICYVDDISKYWKNSIPKAEKDKIVEILYYMNSYNRRENDWLHFIDLQLKNSNHSISIENTEDLYNKIEQNMNDFTVSIMPSGESYLKYIVATFEYFSFRYHKGYSQNYIPLFLAVPAFDEMEQCKKIEDLLCIKIINTVKNKTFECLDIIKENPDIPLHINHNDDSKYHSTRIIEQHKGYINNFITYITDYFINANSITLELKNKYTELVTSCIVIRDEYTKKEQI